MNENPEKKLADRLFNEAMQNLELSSRAYMPVVAPTIVKLLVLAGSPREYDRWCREFGKEIMLGGFDPKYIAPKSLNFHGYRAPTKWVGVGTWQSAGYSDEVLKYFELHDIKKLP